ncbi:uncharacterized protein PGTG_06610 [Puccinia graminis f. sp. tritici CRL 75-36-700-3]|uniref:DNA 3'-5' helicase n=1 Tax=Puccinia graminis f. sp. tritici (strain CRL 75-36-700-3 / race SCCL) TaxID=418459 RepID=E3K8X2_PUCGT|nr:uncharacterized protein PGTG_06610 [Puccinia graminis f. sp. tritici CRL 75-36-700-3]EFP80654.2 hypothetical protein PGTG_06610 [Puccinia graminis f. sp. tritici CRL 75-36-700-3]
MPSDSSSEEPLQSANNDRLPTPLLDDIADDLLPFEEISKLQLQETPIEGPGRLLKSKKGKLTLSSSVTDMNYDKKIKMLRNRSAKTYKDQEPKTVQLESVMDLINRRDTFVLAGTGVGKSRIAEMYWDLFPKYKKPIVLVLNPLDSLGDNQVEEKNALKITAVNLTKMNLNETVEQKILNGDYSFIYLSPEVLLNNAIFTRIFFNETFQNRVSLVVVDEAHMIYVWGLVASGKSKKLFSHGRHQDRAVFRPSYGDIASRLLGIDAPILLLSATCRPQAIKGILASLKINEESISFRNAELSRPDIRIARVPMKASLKSCDDLLMLYGPRSCIPDNEMIPSLIYSTSRNLTMQVSKVVHEARRIPEGHHDPNSTFARRFHAVTGDKSKKKTTEQFAAGQFPVISCTMALGLGQNWKRVRSVIHLGRGDPASICQMIGRCGRGGSPGLALLFVEKSRRGGKNKIEEFTDPTNQTDDERMDALAITPVCLRICFAIDNKVGYVPLSYDDPNATRERAHEIASKFPQCLCSNCEPQKMQSLLDNFRRFRNNNFDLFMENGEDLPEDPLNIPLVRPSTRANFRLGSTKNPLDDVLEDLAGRLVDRFDGMFNETFDVETAEIQAVQMFDIQQARLYALAVKRGLSKLEITRLIGGEMIQGQMDTLQSVVDLYCEGDTYRQYLEGKKKRKRNYTAVDTSTSSKPPTKAEIERERKRAKWLSDSIILEEYKAENEKRIREKHLEPSHNQSSSSSSS